MTPDQYAYQCLEESVKENITTYQCEMCAYVFNDGDPSFRHYGLLVCRTCKNGASV